MGIADSECSFRHSLLNVLLTSVFGVCSYGEKGYELIHALLLVLYPPSSTALPAEINSDVFTIKLVISHVLAPETALHLIMEDMHFVDRVDGLRVLQASSVYGKAAFPAEDDDDVHNAVRSLQTLRNRGLEGAHQLGAIVH